MFNLVSRDQMIDQSILDLQKENEELQAKLAWYEYGIKELEERLALANTECEGSVCHCCKCFNSKRFNTRDGLAKFPKSFMVAGASSSNEEECLVKNNLIFHAKRLGFEVAYVVVLSKNTFHRLSDIVPETCHLVLWNDAETSFWTVEYGPKLDQKDFHKNSMLGKLKELFQILDDEIFFKNPETGEDYVSSSL